MRQIFILKRQSNNNSNNNKIQCMYVLSMRADVKQKMLNNTNNQRGASNDDVKIKRIPLVRYKVVRKHSFSTCIYIDTAQCCFKRKNIYKSTWVFYMSMSTCSTTNISFRIDISYLMVWVNRRACLRTTQLCNTLSLVCIVLLYICI